MSDDDDEQEFGDNSSNPSDHRRRLSEIKFELQRLNREKKKYDVEKLSQDADFLQSEINDINNAINELNQQINQQTSTRKLLHIKMTNLRSRSQLRYANSAIALREKKRYEIELKKENKTEEYRELARRQIRNIDAALPILKEEDEYKERMKVAEDAQQMAMNKRKKLEENLNKILSKQTEIRKLLNENSEKLPMIETNISKLRDERESLLASNSSNRKQRVHRTNSSIIRSVFSIENDALEREKEQMIEQLNKVKSLIRYFREKMSLHGLTSETSNSSSKEQETSTIDDEKTILSSFMNDIDTTLTNDASAIAMKLPRNLSESNGNDIIHSNNAEGNEFQYKKEFSADILTKYGGIAKKNPSKTPKKQRKHFAVSHPPHLITLYNHVRNTSGSFDTLPSMPMFEYELLPTIKSLESIEQSLEFYLNELSRRSFLNKEDDQIDNEDSALETFSNGSSLIEQLDIGNSTSKNIDRQISDEGYRSIRNDLEKQRRSISDDQLDVWQTTVSNSSSSPSII